MKQIFQSIKKLNILSEFFINIFTFMEFVIFFYALDLIFPIKCVYNYYFPLYFFNPLIYLEFTKENDNYDIYGDSNYLENNYNNLKEKENILSYLINFIQESPKSRKIFTFYNRYMLYANGILFTLNIFSLILKSKIINFSASSKNMKDNNNNDNDKNKD
jgi:hypothetical protein